MDIYGDVKPILYPLESENLLSECPEEDTRYREVTESLTRLPTDLEIQTLSGVYESLKKLPYYDEYVTDKREGHPLIEYRLLGRQTISFSTQCTQPISEAAQVLKELETASDASDPIKEFTLTSAVATFCALIFIAPFTNEFFCPKKGTCYPAPGFKVMTILFMVCQVAISVTLFVMSLINVIRLNSLGKGLTDWSHLQSCADSFSQIDEDKFEVL